MKQVLIVSMNFAPDNNIAAIRPTKIAKYLKLTGNYKISVITSNSFGKDALHTDLINLVDFMHIVNKPFLFNKLLSGIVKIFSRITCPINSEVVPSQTIYNNNSIKSGIGHWLTLFEDYLYYCSAKKTVRRKLLYEFDVLFSTYGPYSSHWIARYIKRKNRKVFWIADFRDPVKTALTPPLFKTYARNFAKRICNNANVATSVSQGFLSHVLLPDIPKYIITNVFDTDDVTITANSKSNNRFALVYTGTLYGGKRSMSVVFRVLKELIAEKVIDETRIVVEYAGNDFAIIKQQSDEYELGHIVLNHGFVSRERSIEIQRSCSLLLSLTWNTVESTGVVTGKLLEYMLMGKPVVSIVVGDLSNSIVKEIMDTCRLGFCYEEASNEKDYVLLKKYIHMQYCRFMEKKELIFDPISDEINMYNYNNIVRKLEDLIPPEV